MVREQREQAHKNLLSTNAMLDNSASGSGEAAERMKELLERIKEQDEQIEAMKLYVQQMRSRFQIYVPDKEDPLDTQLAEYINNYPERSKLRIMFMKEGDGVYQFGSRKVYVRVERDRITGNSFIGVLITYN